MNQTSALHVTEIESAINWWRQRSPSVDGITACAQVLALAEVAIGVLTTLSKAQVSPEDRAAAA
jgi:hypothetical protein